MTCSNWPLNPENLFNSGKSFAYLCLDTVGANSDTLPLLFTVATDSFSIETDVILFYVRKYKDVWNREVMSKNIEPET